MEAIAKSGITRISPMKVQWVIEHIKYKKAIDALSILENGNNKASRLLFKVLNQAIANGTNNSGMTLENMFVSYAVANSGPIIKRFSPRAKGSADKISKRTSIIIIKVKENDVNVSAKKGKVK